MTSTAELRVEVSDACRILGALDQGDLVWGHVSARDPNGRGAWMKAAGLGFEEVTPDDVLLVGWDGAVLDGAGRRHVEYPIHTRVLAARGDVGSVVHTHSPSAVAFGSLDVPLRAISHDGTLFVPPDVPRFTETADLIVTDDLGDRVAATLADRPAALLVNHGVVVAHADVPSATVAAVLLDRACRMQLTAMAAGELRRWSDDDEALAKRAHCYPQPLLRQAWDHLVRRLDHPRRTS